MTSTLDKQDTLGRLPWWLKAFMAAFSLTLAVYTAVHQGPWSLFWFCNVALFLATAGMMLERALWVSMAAVGVLVIQLLWIFDLLLTAANLSPIRMTAYMLSDEVTSFKKGLSLFHAWMPPLLGYALWKLGYDARALLYWTLVMCGLLLVSYLFLPAPPAPADAPTMAVNVNYVFGLRMSGPQQRMPELAWLAAMMVMMPLFFFLPAHLALARLFRDAVPIRSSTS
jgi:hypothetical protein